MAHTGYGAAPVLPAVARAPPDGHVPAVQQGMRERKRERKMQRGRKSEKERGEGGGEEEGGLGGREREIHGTSGHFISSTYPLLVFREVARQSMKRYLAHKKWLLLPGPS